MSTYTVFIKPVFIAKSMHCVVLECTLSNLSLYCCLIRLFLKFLVDYTFIPKKNSNVVVGSYNFIPVTVDFKTI